SRATVAPVAQVTLGEGIASRVVRDARQLTELELIGRLVFGADGEDARLGAAIARDAHVLTDDARATGRLDAHRVDGAHVEALGRWTLQARLLVKRPASRISSLDLGIDLHVRVVEDRSEE